MGHARTLISLPNDESKLRVLKKIIENELSVRQVEEICREINNSKPKKNKKIELTEQLLSGKAKLIDHLGTKVDVKSNNKGAGSIVISFDSESDFERILKLLQ